MSSRLKVASDIRRLRVEREATLAFELRCVCGVGGGGWGLVLGVDEYKRICRVLLCVVVHTDTEHLHVS